RKGSLAVVAAGPRRGRWFDHEAGVGGDALALVAHLRGCTMRDAWEWALAWLDGAPAPRARAALQGQANAPDKWRRTAGLARRIWSEAVPPAGTLVERYLRCRGLDLPAGAPLRFHPACPRGAERWPAMLAPMTDPATGEFCGVHRTFLARDGGGKAPDGPGGEPCKMMAGRAGVVRLMPDEEVGTSLGLAEGIETALAVAQRFGWRPVWAAGSAPAIRAFPVLPGVECLTVFADADDGGAGRDAAETCAARWAGAGREGRVWVAPRGEDFADTLIRCRT
ncbi:MAG: toprim domain-containing protein, partial [Acetobacteraceae bacterium]|nr:toprim domain-containing protein [Acetobacteraceae bacterium]